MFGGGGGSAAPPPPTITQYPSVLAPPQIGGVNTISSFSYVEIIDLISDGPIEGLINKNGRKIYEENIFEGIYLNDTPIKETSSIKTQKISIDFLKRSLKDYWNNNKFLHPFIKQPTSFATVHQVENKLFCEKHGLLSDDILYIDIFKNIDLDNEGYYKIIYIDENNFSIKKYNFNNKSIFNDESLAWNSYRNKEIEIRYTENTKIKILKNGSTSTSVDNANFSENIKIQSFHPKDSIFYFIKKINGSFDIQSFLEKALNKNPIEEENVFLTVVEIPQFKIFISKDKFDPTEGGVNGPYPLKISIPNIGNYIYFSISSDSLNSFNYFEIPRTFVENSILTADGKKTFLKTKIPNDNYHEYDIFNLRLFIWSIYSETEGIKNIDKILDRYFNNFIVYQNDASLYNYNLVQNEFKNGMEVQTPLKNFNQVEIETDYSKELIGPFKLMNKCFGSTNSINDYYGVQKLRNLCADSKNKPATTNIDFESSDDIRYIKVWPIEYTTKGACPYLLCCAYANYSLFDKTSASRMCQEAVPITHYVANENVEEVYVTIGLHQLWDTAHVDLASSSNTAFLPGVNKYQQTFDPLPGTRTFGQLGKTDFLINCLKSGYFLIAGNSINDGSIIGFSSNLFDIYSGIAKVIDPSIDYYSSIKSSVGLCTQVPSIDSYITPGKFLNSQGFYNLNVNSPLVKWFIPSESCFTLQSICVNGYINNPSAFETKLKSKNIDGSNLYNFGLTEREAICTNGLSFFSDCTSKALQNFTSSFQNYLTTQYKLFVAEFKYFTAPTSELRSRAIVAVKINDYIDWSKIFKYWDKSKNALPITNNLSSEFYLDIFEEISSSFSNIKKYLVDEFLRLGSLEKIKNPSIQYYPATLLNDIYIVGFSKQSLEVNSFFDINKKFTNPALDQLLEEYVFKSINGLLNLSKNTDISNLNFTQSLEENLKKFESGKLLGFSNIFKFTLISNHDLISYYDILGNIPADRVNIFINSSKTFYDANNIYINNSAYLKVDSNYDAIFFYQLYSDVSSNLNNPSLPTPNFFVEQRDSFGNPTTPTASPNAAKGIQNINAGTKLPAVVRVIIETGYESKEKLNYVNSDEYNKYFFEIFGMSSEMASIDLGRNSYDFVYGERGNFNTAGYLTSTANLYYESKEIYLFKIIFKKDSVNNIYYFLTNKKTFNFADIIFDISQKEEINKNITYIKYNDEILGLKQVVGSLTEIEKLFNDTKSLNSLGLFSLGVAEVEKYFNNNLEEIDLGLSVSFLKKQFQTIGNPINSSETFLNKSIYLLENYSDSFSIYNNNLNKFDCYQIYLNENNFIDLNIYNFKYNSYEIIDVTDPNFTFLTFSDKYYFTFYFEESIGGNTLYNELLNSFPNDALLVFPALEKNINNIYINSKEYSWNLGNFIVRVSKISDQNAEKISLFKYNDPVFGSYNPNINTNTSEFRINLLNHISAYLNEEIILDKIKNKSDFLKDFMTFNFEEIKASLLSENWIAEHKISKSNGLNIFDFKKINNFLTSSDFLSNNNAIYHVGYSKEFVATPIDIRERAKAIQSKTTPLFFNISFWVVDDKNNNTLSLIFKQPSSYCNLTDMNYSSIGVINPWAFTDLSQQACFKVFHNDGALPLTYPSIVGCGWSRNPDFGWDQYGGTFAHDAAICLSNKFQDYYTKYFNVCNWVTTERIESSCNIYSCNCYFVEYKVGDGICMATRSQTCYTLDQCLCYYDEYCYYPCNWIAQANNVLNATFNNYNFSICYTETNDLYNVFNFNNRLDFAPIGFIKMICAASATSSSFFYENPKFKDGFVTFDTPSLKNLTLRIMTETKPSYSIADNSTLLRYVESVFHKKGIMRRDLRFKNFILGSTNFNFKTKNENVIFSLFQDMPINNIDADTNKTFSNDAGTSIKLPPPKYYSDGSAVRRYVKVSKISYETLSPLISKKIFLNKITEIIPQKFSYPFSAMVSSKIDSRAFSQIPTRTFECKLKKILVPSNYFPENEDGEDVRYLEGNGKYKIYDGDWDGTFKLMWTNNPAWILMDMLVNKRYGLGNYIESDQVDIWELYKIGRWCDGVDDNGYYYGVIDYYGGVEPRYTFNAIISEKFNVFEMINQIASVFRGSVYYMNSLITFDDDRLKPIIGEFNNSDVKDGIFNYTNYKKDDEYTAVEVAFVNEKDNYRPSIEYVEDSNGIRKRGILKKQINAFGVTSRGQARRLGLHFLFQTSNENSNVSFTTDIKALFYKPGDLIGINDELVSSYKNYGKIEKIENYENYFVIYGYPKLDINSDIYDFSEISIHTPIIKPKYEDIKSSTDTIPCSLFLSTNNAITIMENNLFYNSTFILNKSEDMNLLNCSYFYTGKIIFPYNKSISCCYDLTLCYIKSNDMNNNNSKYGHWKLITGDLNSQNQNFYLFDSALNTNLKNLNLNQQYFFDLFDSGVYLNYTGSDEFRRPCYQRSGFSLNCEKNNLIDIKINSVLGFTCNLINYYEIIENDRPILETFKITGRNVSDQTSVFYISKSGWINDSFTEKKESVFDNIDSIKTGSYYSLKIKNLNQPIYKILSINESYINEYNISAVQYDPKKFELIEENNLIDDLNSTFNFISAYNSKQKIQNEEDLIKAPIFKNLNILQDSNNKYYLNIKWTPSKQKNLEGFIYKIYINPPSSFGFLKGYEIKGKNNYNDILNEYELNINLDDFGNQIGTYEISIISFSEKGTPSSQVKKSINFLNF